MFFAAHILCASNNNKNVVRFFFDCCFCVNMHNLAISKFCLTTQSNRTVFVAWRQPWVRLWQRFISSKMDYIHFSQYSNWPRIFSAHLSRTPSPAQFSYPQLQRSHSSMKLGFIIIVINLFGQQEVVSEQKARTFPHSSQEEEIISPAEKQRKIEKIEIKIIKESDFFRLCFTTSSEYITENDARSTYLLILYEICADTPAEMYSAVCSLHLPN